LVPMIEYPNRFTGGRLARVRDIRTEYPRVP